MEFLDSELLQNICENVFEKKRVHKFTELTKNVEDLLAKTERFDKLNNSHSMNAVYMRNLYNLKTNIELGLKMVVNHLQDSSYYCLVSDSTTYVSKFCKSTQNKDPSIVIFMNGLHNNFKKQLSSLLDEVAGKLINNELKVIGSIIDFLRDQEDCFKQVYKELKPPQQKEAKTGFFGSLKDIYSNYTETNQFTPLYDKLQSEVTKKYDLFLNSMDFDFSEVCERISAVLPEEDALMFFNMVFFYKLAENLVDDCLERLEADKYVAGEEIALYKLDILKRFDNFFKQKIENRESYKNLKFHMTSMWQSFAMASKTLVATQTSLVCNNVAEFKQLHLNLGIYFKTSYKKSLREIFGFEENFYLLEKYADRLSQLIICSILQLKTDIVDDIRVLSTHKDIIEDNLEIESALRFVKEPVMFFCIISMVEQIAERTKFFSRYAKNRYVEQMLYYTKKLNRLISGERSTALINAVSANKLEYMQKLIAKTKEERNLYKIDNINELLSVISILANIFVDDLSIFRDIDWKYLNYSLEMLCEGALVRTISSLNQTILPRHQVILAIRWILHFMYNSHEGMLENIIEVVQDQKLEFHTLVSNGSKTMILGISGFLSEDTDKTEEWLRLVSQCDFNDITALNWSSDNLENLKSSLFPSLMKNVRTNFIDKGTAHGNSKVLSGINVMLDLYKDNPFIRAYNNAEVTGQHLCQAMLQTLEFRAHRQLDIISFSLGTVVALSFLLNLEQVSPEALHDNINQFYVGDVVLMGSCVDHKRLLANIHRLIGTNGIIKGRLVLVFTKNDSVLKYLFKLARLNENAIGFTSVTADEVVDALHNQDPYLKKLQKCEIEAIVKEKFDCYDLTGIIETHSDYRAKLSYVLKVIGFKNNYDFLDDRHINSQ